MRTVRVICGGLVAAAAIAMGTVAAANAIADETFPSVTVHPTVTPNRAGTVKHPQGVKLHVGITWQSLGAADQPIVTNFTILFPKGSLYNGAKTPSCSLAKVSEGPQACPKASITGSGSGVAYANTTQTRPTITVVNGGRSTVYFYTVLNNPARVQEPIIGHITKLGAGKWAYRLTATVPQNLQIVAGVPIELTSLTINAGRGTWLATTACGPHGKWPFMATTGYLDPDTNATGSGSYSSFVSCRK